MQSFSTLVCLDISHQDKNYFNPFSFYICLVLWDVEHPMPLVFGPGQSDMIFWSWLTFAKNVKPLATAILVNQISRASLCVHTLNFTQKKNYYSKCCWNERDISRSMGGYRILILHTKKEKMKLEVFVETITFHFWWKVSSYIRKWENSPSAAPADCPSQLGYGPWIQKRCGILFTLKWKTKIKA